MVAYNKECNNTLYMIDSIEWTDINGLRIKGNFPISIVQFLDSNIESLEVIDNENKLEIHLKFYGKDAIVCYNPLDLNKYLSSGTIKGMSSCIRKALLLSMTMVPFSTARGAKCLAISAPAEKIA